MIPKFDYYHKNLHSSYLNFAQYIKYLTNEFINGFVMAHDSDRDHYFFLFEGELQSAFCISQDGGQTKIQATQVSNVTKNSFVSTYICPLNFVDYFSKFQAARLVYQNISTKQVSPDKLFNKFGADKFTGFIEKNTTGAASKKAYLYFSKGRMIGGLNVDNKDGYLEKALDDKTAGEKINGSMFSIYALVNQIRNQGEEKGRIIDCFQEIFQMLEAHTSPSQFSTLWRMGARELSHQYEFLDPLIARFQYRDRQIYLNEKINLKQAVPGISQLVYLIAERLSVDAGRIDKIKNKYSSLLAAYEHSN